MKNLNFVISTLSLSLTIGYTSKVSAFFYTGTLGKSVGAIDLFQVNCRDELGFVTAKLSSTIKVKTTEPTVKVSVTTQKGVHATNVTDSLNGDIGSLAFCIF